jgi:hypothetical protein
VLSSVKHTFALNAHFSPFNFVSFELKIVRNSTAKHERIYKEEDKEEEEKPRTLFFAK